MLETEPDEGHNAKNNREKIVSEKYKVYVILSRLKVRVH